MGKHETPPDGYEGDGKVPDEVNLAELLTEPDSRHSAAEGEEDGGTEGEEK
ncbi:MAG: hypothetical protein ACRDRI_25915 [Pseudonocardiaceae bacterium]